MMFLVRLIYVFIEVPPRLEVLEQEPTPAVVFLPDAAVYEVHVDGDEDVAATGQELNGLGYRTEPIAGREGNVVDWLARLEALPGWQHPYELLPKKSAEVRVGFPR